MRFEALATAAALGTARRPVDRASLPDAVAGTLPDGHEDPAALLLDAAASFALVRRATVAPGPDAPPLALPAPTRPQAPDAFVALFHRARAGGSLKEPLTREALRLLAERGLTLPPALLLDLLAELDRPDAPRRLVAAVLDERGWALVRLNSHWGRRLAGAGTAETLDDRVWAEGTLAQRVAHLTALRAADPAAGRALVAGLEWKKETADARAQFLGALLPGLSPDDEVLLERGLDDRARGVREVAAGLLARLPGSAFSARAEALATAHVRRERRPLRGVATVAHGVPRTAATTRDGYPADEDSPAAARQRLAHVIALVPTDRWPALVGASAAELAVGPVEGDGGPVDLTGAWVLAALRRRDADLASALVAAHPEAAARLLPVLPSAERARQLVRLVRGAPERYAALDDALAGPFDAALTAAALELAEVWAGAGGQGRWVLPRLLARLSTQGAAAGAGPAAARLQAIAERLPADERSLRRSLADAAAALQLRAALADSLADHPVLHAVPADQEG